MSDEFLSCVPSSIRVEQMQIIRNLIEVKISDEQLAKANLSEGLQVQIRSEKPFTLNAYWIVKINDLHSEIEKDWKTLRDELWENKFLRDGNKSLLQNQPQIHLESNETVQCSVKPPQTIDTSSMTVTPRDFYPLVIIVTCHEEEPDPKATDAAANIHIVHIKDSTVTLKSHVIKQYMKQIDGKILDISQLYAEESAACFICFEEANPEEQLQLFCLLPCRHSPICSNCIRRIRECPKCRCPIATVFDINTPPVSEANRQPATGGEIDPRIQHLYDDPNTTQNQRQSGFLASIKSLFGI